MPAEHPPAQPQGTERRHDEQSPGSQPSESAAGGRMGWLDGLRAVAALLVVYAHLSRYLFTGARAVSAEWLNAGPAGVMLFFLVSGFIIPASLERHGDLRRFWISRVFRLLPLYVTVSVVVVVLGLTKVVPLDPYVSAHPVTTAVAHLTMVPFLLGVPLVTPVLWTLTYEMAFYLLVTALFTAKKHEKSGMVAVGLAVVAVLTAPLAPHLLTGTHPATAIAATTSGAGTAAIAAASTTGGIGVTATQLVTAVVAAVLIVGLAAVTSGRPIAIKTGGLLLGALSLTLLLTNQDPAHVWDGLLIVAVMCTGTTIYRAQAGQIAWWRAAITGAVVAVALLVNWFAELRSLDGLIPRYEARSVITLVTFGGAFAVAAYRKKVPRILAWLGTISYSIYLIHYVLIELLGRYLLELHGAAQIPGALGYLGLLVGLAWLAYRYVELPGQRLGRRLTRSAAAPPRIPRQGSARSDRAAATAPR